MRSWAMQHRGRSQLLAIAGVLLFVLLVMAIVGLFIPIVQTRTSYCFYCRASRTDRYIFCMKISPLIKESRLSRYIRSSVDPRHTHAWRGCYSSELYTMGEGTGDGPYEMNHFMARVPENAEIVILRAIPTRSERDHFIKDFSVADWYSLPVAEHDRRMAATDTLSEAYKANPSRKDWPIILRKLKLLP